MGMFRSLKVALAFLVFMIMICSSILSGIILIFLNQYNIFAQLESARILFLITGLITSTIIGTILTYPLGRYLLKPLDELIEATREVSKGDFSVKVNEVKKNNLFSELIRSFNIMTKELGSIEMFRKDFINNFSHEFRTPIVSIRGFARQLKNTSLTDEKSQEYIEIIIRESERLTNMSTNILFLTKLENQEIITDKKLFSLDEQIRNCILLLQIEWERKDINLNLELDYIEYCSDEEMLSHVWLNLLGNAIKFSKYKGEITIKCRDEISHIKVEISDNGMGMDDETIHQIFEKFYQGDSSRTTEGNGLGLSLVKRIIDLCGGEIGVKSYLGNGTDIIVKLPK